MTVSRSFLGVKLFWFLHGLFKGGSQGTERTLVIIKPDGVRRGLVGRVLQRFEERELRIVSMNMLEPARTLVESHYEEHRERVFFDSLIRYMTSGPIVVVVLEGRNVISTVRRMLGTTDASLAEPGTIRGDFCTSKEQNLVHASENLEQAAREIHLWTPDLALVDVCLKNKL